MSQSYNCAILYFLQELTTSLQGEEDKANRLSKLKTKLENTIAETNDELEREKRQRGDVEKIRRKLEADLKVSYTHVELNLDNWWQRSILGLVAS